jgi:hypothetical protein
MVDRLRERQETHTGEKSEPERKLMTAKSLVSNNLFGNTT